MTDANAKKDVPLYRCLKKMEWMAQGMIFEIPQEESEAWRAMNIDASELWRIGALIHTLNWFNDKARSAANRVYLQMRPTLQDELTFPSVLKSAIEESPVLPGPPWEGQEPVSPADIREAARGYIQGYVSDADRAACVCPCPCPSCDAREKR